MESEIDPGGHQVPYKVKPSDFWQGKAVAARVAAGGAARGRLRRPQSGGTAPLVSAEFLRSLEEQLSAAVSAAETPGKLP